MDIKKSPKANLEDKRLTYILIGFVVALSVIFVAFEWTQTEVKVHEIEEEEALFEEELQIDQTIQEETPPPPPAPEEVPDVIEEIVVVADDKEVGDIDFSSEENKDEVIKLVEVVVAKPEEEEDVEEIFVVVEEMPEFPGGSAALAKYFSENIKYPVMAAENGIQGRVICNFTVWKDGTIRDIVVVRGVDKSLDREAIRLVENMPKWKAGKQRGKAVSCKFTLPVVFRLQ